MIPRGPKKRSQIKLEPLKGKFFDIKSASSAKKAPRLAKTGSFFRFTLVALVAFFFLNLGNAYILGKDLILENKQVALMGYDHLKNGIESLLNQDSDEAIQFFQKAESSFYELNETTRHLTAESDSLLAQNLYFDAANKLTEGALEVSQMGQQLATMMEDLSEFPEAVMQTIGGEDGDLIGLLLEKKEDFDEVLVLTISLQQKLATLNEKLLPENLQDKIIEARHQIGEVLALLLDAEANFDVALELLGDRRPHSYLVLLQNNHELRATGGFPGSYLLIEVNDGKITKMQPTDIYETDGQLQAFVDPPPGIDQVADRLYMRDANYSPDFPISAEQIRWFLEQGKGPSIDTVIAIDQSVVEELLELTGPLRLENFPFQISSENFSDVISFYTEAKLSDSTTPKQLLFDLIPAFQNELSNIEDPKQLIDLGLNLVKGGHIQVHSVDPKIQNLIARLELGGSMIQVGQGVDYLSVITTSIGGNKSDQYIKTNLHHKTMIEANGQMKNELVIKKAHTWGHAEETQLENLIALYGTGKLTKKDLYYILGRGPNTDYMRVYVPLGSELKKTSGIELSEVETFEDLNYTVFAFTYGPVNAGDSKEVVLSYTLPHKLSFQDVAEYKLIAEKQAGAENITLKKEVQVAESLQVVEGDLISDDPSSGVLEVELEEDENFTVEIKN